MKCAKHFMITVPVRWWRLGAMFFLSTSLMAAIAASPSRGQTAAALCANPLTAEAQGIAALALDPQEVAALHQFYQSHEQNCAWSQEQIASLRSVLIRASDQALEVTRYHVEAIEPGDVTSPGAAARDLFATAMALRYAHDLAFGRIDLAKIDPDIDVSHPYDDLPRQLASALTQPDLAPWLTSLLPAEAAYRRLTDAFRRYRDRVTGVEAPPIAAGPTLKPGASDPRISALKERLHALGDLRDSGTGPDFDQATKAALAAFQRRHGIADDGRLGPATLAWLNVPDRDRVRQIATNLERRRYFARRLPARRVEVNTAAATAQLIEDDHVVLAMRAVVGDRRHPSPMLISPSIDAIVLNPPWIVPVSIIRHEVEPKLARDPNYLERNAMQWQNGQLVQAPGPKNSLGLIKFDFPNPFSVYMHDTPARALFAKDDRARSHGCVRLEKPLALAVELLKHNPDWPRQRLEEAIAGGATQKIVLADGPAVAFVYWTAFVDEDGTVEFRDDIYGRDARLEAALAAENGGRVSLAEIGCPGNRS